MHKSEFDAIHSDLVAVGFCMYSIKFRFKNIQTFIVSNNSFTLTNTLIKTLYFKFIILLQEKLVFNNLYDLI